MYSPETQSRLQQLRHKALAGTATVEEFQQAIELMRQGRQVAALGAAAGKTKRAGKPKPSADDLFDELDKL